MAQGHVKWFDATKGYGFITPMSGGPDLFVHYQDIQVDGHRSLMEGQTVEYELGQGAKGPTAVAVRMAQAKTTG